MAKGKKGSRRPPKTEVPPGLIMMVAETMEKKIRTCLADAKRELSQYSTVARIHLSDDGVIEAEIVVDVPRGERAHDVLTDLDAALRPIPVSVGYELDQRWFQAPQTWISTGVHVPLRPAEIISMRYAVGKRGVTHAGSFYRRSKSAGSAFSTGKQIVRNFAKKGRRKPESVFCRIHWNPFDVKPDREG